MIAVADARVRYDRLLESLRELESIIAAIRNPGPIYGFIGATGKVKM